MEDISQRIHNASHDFILELLAYSDAVPAYYFDENLSFLYGINDNFIIDNESNAEYQQIYKNKPIIKFAIGSGSKVEIIENVIKDIQKIFNYIARCLFNERYKYTYLACIKVVVPSKYNLDYDVCMHTETINNQSNTFIYTKFGGDEFQHRMISISHNCVIDNNYYRYAKEYHNVMFNFMKPEYLIELYNTDKSVHLLDIKKNLIKKYKELFNVDEIETYHMSITTAEREKLNNTPLDMRDDYIKTLKRNGLRINKSIIYMITNIQKCIIKSNNNICTPIFQGFRSFYSNGFGDINRYLFSQKLLGRSVLIDRYVDQRVLYKESPIIVPNVTDEQAIALVRIYPVIADIHIYMGYKILELYKEYIQSLDITVYRTCGLSVFDTKILHDCAVGDEVVCPNYMSTSLTQIQYDSGFHNCKSPIIIMEITFNAQRHAGLYAAGYFGKYKALIKHNANNLIYNKYMLVDDTLSYKEDVDTNHNNSPTHMQNETEITMCKNCRYKITRKRVIMLQKDLNDYGQGSIPKIDKIKKIVISLEVIRGEPLQNAVVISNEENGKNIIEYDIKYGESAEIISVAGDGKKFTVNVDYSKITKATYFSVYDQVREKIIIDLVSYKESQSGKFEKSEKSEKSEESEESDYSELMLKYFTTIDHHPPHEILENLLNDRNKIWFAGNPPKTSNDIKGGGENGREIIISAIDKFDARNSDEINEIINYLIYYLTNEPNSIGPNTKLPEPIYNYKFVDNVIFDIISKVKIDPTPEIASESLQTDTSKSLLTKIPEDLHTKIPEYLPNKWSILKNKLPKYSMSDPLADIRSQIRVGQLTAAAASGGAIALSQYGLINIILIVIICLLIIALIYYIYFTIEEPSYYI
jgi:hypothetical protein